MTAVTDIRPTNQVELAITGMTCASCANHIEHKLDGVTATVNYATEKARVNYPQGLDPQELIGQVEAAGYAAALPAASGAPEAAAELDSTRALRTRLLVSLTLSVPVVAMAMVPALQFTYCNGFRSRWPRRCWCGGRCRSTAPRGRTCATARPPWTRSSRWAHWPRSGGRSTPCSSAPPECRA